MKIEMHPDAKANFDLKIEELKLKLQFRDIPTDRIKANKNPNTHIAGTFDESNIIGDLKVSLRDENGSTAARAFGENGRLLGIFDEDYKEIIRIAERMRKAIGSRPLVTEEELSEMIFDWITRKYRGEDISCMTTFVLSECEKKIQVADVWIPISHLFIQSPFTLGLIHFRAITKEMMDEYECSTLAKLPDDDGFKAKLRFRFNEKRSKFQALAVATFQTEATPEQAYQLAFEETEKTVAVLRFFSPFSVLPNKICYVAPLGKQHMDSNYYFLVENGKFIFDSSGTSDRNMDHWNLKNEALEQFKAIGLETLNSLLVTNKLTDFQAKLLECVYIYSKGMLAKDVADRLLYTMVALESVFLRDASESIQENFSLRMAYMHPVNVKKRREMIAVIKDAYKLRSSFVHHGKKYRPK